MQAAASGLGAGGEEEPDRLCPRAPPGEERAGGAYGGSSHDGKVLRGTWEEGRQLRLLHLFSYKGALALDQMKVAEGAGETAGAEEWVRQMADEFPGLELLTGDAILAERSLCEAIVASQRDYLVKLKRTRPSSTGQ